MQFYILMVDYGRRGLEAVVKPEMTRRQIVEEYRAAERPVFVKFVDGNHIFDCTDEIKAEAPQSALDEIEPAPIASRFDHDRDLRKHEERV